MHLGILQTSVASDSLEKAFQIARAAGAQGLEVACQSESDVEALFSDAGVKTINRLRQMHALEVPSLALNLLCANASLFGSGSEVARACKLITQAMHAAGIVGAQVVLVPFFGKATIETDLELDRVIGNLLDLAEQADAAEVTLGVESTLNADQQLYLLSHMAPYTSVKMYFDTGNMLARKLDPAKCLRDLGKGNICQMHFKDCRLSREGEPPDFKVALGQGNVDFKAVANAMAAVGFDGWVVLETPAGEDALASAKANLDFARGVLH
jgi:hexulose-6-phosphate isomerase